MHEHGMKMISLEQAPVSKYLNDMMSSLDVSLIEVPISRKSSTS